MTISDNFLFLSKSELGTAYHRTEGTGCMNNVLYRFFWIVSKLKSCSFIKVYKDSFRDEVMWQLYILKKDKQKYLLKIYERAFSIVMNGNFTTASTDLPSQWNKVPSQTQTGFSSQGWSLTTTWITLYKSFYMYFLKLKLQPFSDPQNEVRHFASQNF